MVFQVCFVYFGIFFHSKAISYWPELCHIIALPKMKQGPIIIEGLERWRKPSEEQAVEAQRFMVLRKSNLENLDYCSFQLVAFYPSDVKCCSWWTQLEGRGT